MSDSTDQSSATSQADATLAPTVTDNDATVAAVPSPDGQTAATSFTPNDPYFSQQYFYNELGDIQTIWSEYNGAGVHVGNYDDGIDFTNPDLSSQQDSTSYEVVVNGQAQAGAPDDAHGGEGHGTSTAGLIAASGNNGTGVIGVAWGSKLTSVNIFDSANSYDIDSSNLTGFYSVVSQMSNFDVTNNSWGYGSGFYSDNNQNKSNSFTANLVQNYASVSASGRDGLGTVIVQAAGNDGSDGNGSGIDASRYTLTVGAINKNGTLAADPNGIYSDYGSSVLVCGVGGDVDSNYNGTIVTTDETGSAGFNKGGSNDGFDGTGDYTSTFDGTSAATPMVTGIVALMMQANPNLGWRDIQNILAASASYTDAPGSTVANSNSSLWTTNASGDWNGGGDHISFAYGYGVANAYNAVRMAEAAAYYEPTAQTSANEQSYSSNTLQPNLSLVANGQTTYTFNVTNAIDIEHVDMLIGLGNVSASTYANLTITLTSPDGTTENLYVGSLENGSNPGGQYWTYGVDGLRGELAAGTWTLTIANAGTGTGTLNAANLTIYGSTPSTAKVYHYTDEFHTMAGQNASRTTLNTTGSNGWIDASTLHSASTVNLSAGTGTIDNTAFTIAGSGVTNVIGGDGADTFTAGAAGGELVGMRGNDTLTGNIGADTFVGGQGADTFVETVQPTAVVDTIKDYDQADSGAYAGSEGDRIDLSSLYQADYVKGTAVDAFARVLDTLGSTAGQLQIDIQHVWTTIANLIGIGLGDAVDALLQGANSDYDLDNFIKIGSSADLASAIADLNGSVSSSARDTIEITANGVASSQNLVFQGEPTTIQVDTGTTTLSGIVSGSASEIDKTGAGTLVLSGQNTFAAPITVSAGKLVVTSDSNLGQAGTALTLQGGTLEITADGFNSARNIALGTNVVIQVDAGTATLSGTLGNVSGGKGSTLNKTGAGSLILAQANTYSGGTKVLVGTVGLDHTNGNGVVDALGSGTVTLAGGAVEALIDQSSSLQSYTVLAGKKGTIEAASGETFYLNNDGSDTLENDGTLVFGSSTATGTVQVQLAVQGTGEVDVLGGTALDGNGSLSQLTSQASTTRVAAGAVLDLGLYGSGNPIGSSPGIANLQNSGATGGTVQWNSNPLDIQAGSFSGKLAGSGGLIKDSGGTLTLAGTSTYAGGTTIQAGTLVLRHKTAAGTIDAAGTDAIAIDGGGTLDLAVSGTLANEVDFDSGTATLAAATGITATFTGAFGDDGASTIVFGSASAKGTVVVSSQTGKFSGPGASTIEVAGGTLRDGGGLGIILSPPVAFAGTVTAQIDAGATLDLHGFSDLVEVLTGAGTLTNAAGATTTIDGGTFSGVIAGAGSVVFATGSASSGTTTLSGVSTYTGATTIAAGATLSLGTLAKIASASSIALSGTLQLGGDVLSSGAISASAASTLSGYGTVAAALSDAGSVVVATGKTLTFTSNDTFSGAMSGAGYLRFANGIDTLASGASLSAFQTQVAGATVTLGATVTDSKSLLFSSGTLALGSYYLAVSGASTFSGGTMTGAGTGAPGVGVLQTKGATSLSGLTLSGSTLSNFGALTQTGTLSLAGASGIKDSEANQKGATWTLSDGAALTLTEAATDSFSNGGNLRKMTGTGTATVGIGIVNSGTISDTSGTLHLAGAITGTGSETIGSAGIMELGNIIAATQSLTFSGSGGHLLLDDAHDFHAGVTGFAHGDTMDLSGFASSGETFTYTSNGSTSAPGGTLAIKSGAETASIALHGTYTGNLFHLATDSHGGTVLTYG